MSKENTLVEREKIILFYKKEIAIWE